MKKKDTLLLFAGLGATLVATPLVLGSFIGFAEAYNNGVPDDVTSSIGDSISTILFQDNAGLIVEAAGVGFIAAAFGIKKFTRE